MKKMIAFVLAACFALIGCTAGPMISAGSGAVPYADMSAVPPGLAAPELEGYEIEQPAENAAVLTAGDRVIRCEYAAAPGSAVAAFSEAVADEGKREDLAGQYAAGLGDGYSTQLRDFFGAQGFLLAGTLREDTTYGTSGQAAVYAVLPYNSYLIMIYAFAPEAQAGELQAQVNTFLDGFTSEL